MLSLFVIIASLAALLFGLFGLLLLVKSKRLVLGTCFPCSLFLVLADLNASSTKHDVVADDVPATTVTAQR